LRVVFIFIGEVCEVSFVPDNQMLTI
jgi:hypothetical protein